MNAPTEPLRRVSLSRIHPGASVAVALVAAIVTGTAWWHERTTHLEEAGVEVRNDARLLARDIAGEFDRIDLALRAVAFHVKDQEAAGDVARLESLLVQTARAVASIEYLRVTDAEGVVRVSSLQLPPAPVSQADREFFRDARDRPGDGPVVDGPLLGRISRKQVLVLSRRLEGRDGTFRGIVFAAVAADYFERPFATAGLPPGAVIALRAADLSMVHRHPATAAGLAQVGRPAPDIRDLVRVHGEAPFLTPSATDGIERVYAFTRVEGYPFVVNVGRPVSEALANVHRNVAAIALAGLLLVGGTTLVTRRLQAEGLERLRAQEALAQSESRLAMALDASSDALWDWRPAENRAYVSPAYERMLGYGPGELGEDLRENWIALLHPEDRERTLDEVRRQLRDQGAFELEYRLRGRQGAWRWIMSRGRCVERAGAEVRRALGTHSDITARKALELALRDANAEMEAVVETAPVGIVLLRERRVVRCNRRLEETFGWDTGELAGQPTRIWYEDDESYDLAGRVVYEGTADGAIDRRELRLVRRDGTPFWARVTTRAIEPARPSRGVIAIVEDISGERDAAHALREAKEAAEGATRAKAEFLASMSHEIRTPMNAIIGMTHLALRTELTPRQRDHLQKIRAASQHLLGIVNDVLDFSKIEAGRLALERAAFDLDHCLERVAVLLAERAGAKGLELVIDRAPGVPTALEGDALRLEQVLANLGTNAVKFTERGEVVIACRRLPGPAGEAHLAFSVRDTGIGLAPEARARLFRRFEQAEASTARRYGGTGLGLVIARRLVELMGGAIAVESATGTGSTFTFDVRLGLGPDKPRTLVPPAGLRGRRMLVVDDNATAREATRAMLGAMTFDADAASSGEEALGLARAAAAAGRPYGIAWLDAGMPGLDGAATARALRTALGGPPPRLALMAAAGSEESPEVAGQAGIDAFVAKPLGPAALFEAAMALLGDGGTAAAHPEQAREATGSLAPSGRARILLVEDNELNQEVARELLESAGFEVDVAANGEIALGMVRPGRYDLVFMDMQMPVMDGLDATRALRADATLAGLPIVAMTANAQPSDRDACLAAGMDEYLAKPIEPEALWELLRRRIPARPPHDTPPPSREPRDEPAVSPATASAACDRLAHLLVNADLRARDAFAVHARLLQQAYPEDFEAIREAMRRFDLEAAAAALARARARHPQA